MSEARRARRWPPRIPQWAVYWAVFLTQAVAYALFVYPVLVDMFGQLVALATCAIVGGSFSLLIQTMQRIWTKLSAQRKKVPTHRGMSEVHSTEV